MKKYVIGILGCNEYINTRFNLLKKYSLKHINKDLFDIKSLKGKKLLLTWGRGALARSWNSPQASLLLASRLGMNIEIARPDGYDMDENIYKQVANNCSHNGGKFSVTNHPELGYHGANVVYSRNWISPKAYKKNKFNKQILENKFSFDVDMVDNGEDAVKALSLIHI